MFIAESSSNVAVAAGMSSKAVQAAQPPDAVAKIDPAARAARAEAPPKKKRVTPQRPFDYYQRSDPVDRLSAGRQ